MSKVSIYDLAYSFILMNYSKEDEIPKSRIVNAIKKILDSGATSEYITDYISSNKCADKDFIKFFSNMPKDSRVNILKQGEYYYHNELRIYAEPPSVHYDINLGHITRDEFDYFLEMRASYTAEDMANYVLSKKSFMHLRYNVSRLIGALKTLISRYNAEIILFTIDTADRIISENDTITVTSVFALEDFISYGIDSRERKRTECVRNGEQLTPRKRVLFNGN